MSRLAVVWVLFVLNIKYELVESVDQLTLKLNRLDKRLDSIHSKETS